MASINFTTNNWSYIDRIAIGTWNKEYMVEDIYWDPDPVQQNIRVDIDRIDGGRTDDNSRIDNIKIYSLDETIVETTTELQGYYYLDNIPVGAEPGVFNITALHEDYMAQTESITLRSGQEDLGQDFELQELFSRPPPPSPAILSGTITDEFTGEAIQGVLVYTSGGLNDTTNTYGQYIIRNIPPGAYIITASATGYEDSSQNVNLDEGETKTMDFPLQLSPPPSGYARVQGEVTDVSVPGIPIEGARIRIYSRSRRRRYIEETTNREGKYVFKKIPVNGGIRGLIVVFKYGYISDIEPITLSSNEILTVDFRLRFRRR